MDEQLPKENLDRLDIADVNRDYIATRPGSDRIMFPDPAANRWAGNGNGFQSTLPTLQQLVLFPDSEKDRYDVAASNLAFSLGLPGAEKIDPALCLLTVNRWTEMVRNKTEQGSGQFQRRSEEYHNSWAYFRVLVMITVLQRDLGVRYNPAKISEDAPFDVNDVCISGIIQGEGGTCASMPVLYAAVGRRLGYPIRLVSAKGVKYGHCFARWDDPNGDRFNIEAGKGLSCHPDDYYRTGMYQIRPEDEEKFCLLKSHTPKEELATFLMERGCFWKDHGDLGKALKCFAWASNLFPHNKPYARDVLYVLDEWEAKLTPTYQAPFPALTIHYPPPIMRDVPHWVERRIYELDLMEGLSKAIHHDPLGNGNAGKRVMQRPSHVEMTPYANQLLNF